MNEKPKQDQCSVYERRGQLVLALNCEKMIPENAPVRLVSAVLEELDYEALYRSYSPRGRKSAADPQVLFEVKLCITQLNNLKKLCPPPAASACELSNAWNTIFHTDQPSRRIKKIVFQGKKFAPYLGQINSEQELEELFLEFLKQKFA